MAMHGHEQSTLFLPIGTGIKNHIILKENLEDYLNTTLPEHANRNPASF